ncbi:DUF2169 domain-containing protein [Vibrio lamellibrachiae]|uniref:DUF2169 family type VI secretion system accessory protein n=1 Tax=Vibrio lamellibrachiae TaxID=2910253 RepID=UPI003D1499C1
MQLWDIESTTELAIKGCFQRDEAGNEVWVVTAKRAWRWIEGQWVESGDADVLNTPHYVDEVGQSAMICDHDFHLDKLNTDVIVKGKARAYAKKPVTYLECRLLIDGHIDKTLAITGERKWVEHARALTMTKAQPFTEKEIDYSQAFGGDERNRLGRGVGSSQELSAQIVPSVFYLKEESLLAGIKTRVAGFGPLPPFFSSRYEYAGTFDERWGEERRPLLPLDFDRRYYQSAPFDQQCNGHLEGGERMMLSGFCHDDTISFRTPKEKYLACAKFDDEQHRKMPISTIFVDTESKEITISYSATFPCQGKEHLLVRTLVEQTRI